MYIGKIVKSDSHINYVCQIYGPREVELEPALRVGGCLARPAGASIGELQGGSRDDGSGGIKDRPG